MNKTKPHILCTKTLEPSLIDKVRAVGMDIDVVPFISILPVVDDTVSQQIFTYLQQQVSVVFTSTNAVDAVTSHVQQQPDWNIYCIGGATQDAITEHFGQDAVKGPAWNASDLADVIIKDNVKEVVFFCGDIRRDELPDKLKNAGITVNEVVVYKNITTPKALDTHYDGILFFSPSAANSFFSMNNISADTVLFAIGSTTATALQHFTDNTVIVSDKPRKEELVATAIAHFGKQLIENK